MCDCRRVWVQVWTDRQPTFQDTQMATYFVKKDSIPRTTFESKSKSNSMFTAKTHVRHSAVSAPVSSEVIQKIDDLVASVPAALLPVKSTKAEMVPCMDFEPESAALLSSVVLMHARFFLS